MDQVKITIEGEGLSLTKFTTLQKAGQIISFLGFDADRSGSGSPVPMASALLAKQSKPRDIVFTSGAKTYPQKIAALAKYLRDQSEQSSFSSDELKIHFKKMGDEPKNFLRDLNKAVELQYIILVDEKRDLYELTDKGSNAVQDGFTKDVAKKISGKKRNFPSKGVRDEVKKMSIVGSLEGYPDYHKLPIKADKILWLMQYADANGVKGLTPTEIDYLSTELRDRIEAQDFAAHNARNIKKSFITKTPNGFLIQKKGSDHLKEILQPTKVSPEK